MDSGDNDKPAQNKKRACLKLGAITTATIVLIAALGHFVTDQALDELKHSLSLWTIVAIVIIINLVSFLCFLILYSAYQWVRSDLKPHEEEPLDKE